LYWGFCPTAILKVFFLSGPAVSGHRELDLLLVLVRCLVPIEDIGPGALEPGVLLLGCTLVIRTEQETPRQHQCYSTRRVWHGTSAIPDCPFGRGSGWA